VFSVTSAVWAAAAVCLLRSAGRKTRVGLLGAIGFHVALWLFGWGVTIYVVIMLPALILLFRAERRAATVSEPAAATTATGVSAHAEP
jgi:hypothetical protein